MEMTAQTSAGESTTSAFIHNIPPSIASSIPIEILASIFKECIHQAHVPPPGKFGDTHTRLHHCHVDCLSWIQVTHVSRHWRFAALSYNWLWSQVTSDCIHWMMEMLRRSGDVHLSFHVDAADLGKVEDELVVRGISRARELIVRYNSSEAIAHILARVEDVPFLRILALSGYDLPLTPPTAPVHLITSKAPGLDALHLYDTNPDWTAETAFPPRLKRLVLYFSDLDRLRPSCSQLASMLQQVPGLEEVTFHNSLPREPTALPRTDLPSSLQHLTITGRSTELHHFFAHHRPPRTLSQAKLLCLGEDVEYDYTLLHAPIFDLMMPEVNPPPHPLEYAMPRYARDENAPDIDPQDCYTEVSWGVVDSELRMHTSFWRQNQLPAGPPPITTLDRARVPPTIDLVYSTVWVGGLTTQLQNAPFFDTIRHMTIYGAVRQSPALVMLIQQTKSLRSLVLQPDVGSEILDYVESGLIGSRSRMASPELETIVLQGVDFNAHQYRKHTAPVLSFCLNARGQCGRPLKRLIFKRCRNIRMEKWAGLREKYGTELVEEPDDSGSSADQP